MSTPLNVDIDTLNRIKNLLESSKSYAGVMRKLEAANVVSTRNKPFTEAQIRDLDKRYWNICGRKKKEVEKPIPVPGSQVMLNVPQTDEDKILLLAADILTNRTVPPAARIKAAISLLS